MLTSQLKLSVLSVSIDVNSIAKGMLHHQNYRLFSERESEWKVNQLIITLLGSSGILWSLLEIGRSWQNQACFSMFYLVLSCACSSIWLFVLVDDVDCRRTASAMPGKRLFISHTLSSVRVTSERVCKMRRRLFVFFTWCASDDDVVWLVFGGFGSEVSRGQIFMLWELNCGILKVIGHVVDRFRIIISVFV